MSIQGVRLTDNFVTDARPKNWREGILLLFPNGKAPLFALTSGMKKKVTDDPEYYWWDKVMPTHRLEITADIADGVVTTITVGATDSVNNAVIAGLKLGTVMRIEGNGGELVYVDANPASGGTTISVVRGWAGSTAAALDINGVGINPNMHSVGNQYGENSDAPSGISFDPTKRSNFTQIFRDTLEMSRTAQKTRLRTGDQVKEGKRETLEIHAAQIEKAMWFGEPLDTDTDPQTGNITRSTGGVFNFIDSNNIIDVAAAPYSGAFDLKDLEDWMELAFRYGSSEKLAFCGNAAALQIQRVCRTNSSYQFMQGQKEFGMNVSRLTSPFGDVVIKTHPLWNQVTGGTNTLGAPNGVYTGLNSWMCILDMAELVYRYLTDADTVYQPKLQSNGLDGIKSGYLTECGLEVHHPPAHLLIQNLQGAKVDD